MIDRAVVADNVGALGVIYYAAMLEESKAFEVVDHLAKLFLSGVLPVSPAGAGNALSTYWGGTRNLVSEADRRRHYSRAFGLRGDDAGAQNRDFHGLWMRFVASVSAFARQCTTDEPSGEKTGGSIDQERVRKAGRDLAANLSLHGAGMTIIAAELGKQFDELIKVLSDPEIQAAYGAHSVGQVVERVAALDLGGSRNSVRYLAMADSATVIFTWLASRSKALWSTTVDVLDLDDIRNRRRGASPTTDPTDHDLEDACEQWLAASGIDERRIEEYAEPGPAPEVRDAVGALLAKNAAYARLPPATQAQIAHDTARIADYLATPEGTDAFAALLERVDFPDFVADLIQGVFNAIVDASIQQMNAYGALVAAVAASVDHFRDSNVTDVQLRDRLCEQFPRLCELVDSASASRAKYLDRVAEAVRRRLATSRQQLLATMVIMGINRIVVTRG